MSDIVNILIAVMTIAFGGFGFFAPRFTAKTLDMAPTASTMGLSEYRASAGGLFVAVGLVCIATGAGWAYAMLGVAYAGAATGRAVSMILDKPPQPKALMWFALEAFPALWLILVNWPDA
ncbi:hypothetical protein GGQ68_001597 [Sagittula marina]|uniref:DUF4345 domain-containing protein n=1 Tax=Sagittula marina TaxID=943940 RepID=A0A7W6DLP0_9RHOB|nr:DUF4345 family protein [Sagittula marina]MBB3985268.1 hypothetical protein [Sagittula marina]